MNESVGTMTSETWECMTLPASLTPHVNNMDKY